MRRVLVVDDQPPILEILRRQLSSIAEVTTAASGVEGLALIGDSEPFAVVVSDMGMPKMNGSQFLERVREVSPDSSRIILTGQAELESTIAAVNVGRVFRFLTKPCKAPELLAAVEAGVEQHELVTAQKELLERTLHGTVQVLTEILAVTNPVAQKRATRIARYAGDMCTLLDVPMSWQLKIALMLSQVGCISLPEEVLSKIHAGQALTEEDQLVYRSHPALAAKLLGGIPRLEVVASIVSSQLAPLAVVGQPADLREWSETSFGALILKVCFEFDRGVIDKLSRDQILELIGQEVSGLPTPVAKALRVLRHAGTRTEAFLVSVSDLHLGMVLDEDVVSVTGVRLVSKGQEVSRSILLRLQSFADGVGVVQPFRVTASD